jgi:hypothetical protein
MGCTCNTNKANEKSLDTLGQKALRNDREAQRGWVFVEQG